VPSEEEPDEDDESESGTNVPPSPVVPIDDKKAIADLYTQNRAADLEQSRATRIDNIRASRARCERAYWRGN
jgi:hypothetical protein